MCWNDLKPTNEEFNYIIPQFIRNTVLNEYIDADSSDEYYFSLFVVTKLIFFNIKPIERFVCWKNM